MPFKSKGEKVKINNKPFTFTPGKDGSLISDDPQIREPQLYQGPVSQSKIVPGGQDPNSASYLNVVRKKRPSAGIAMGSNRG